MVFRDLKEGIKSALEHLGEVDQFKIPEPPHATLNLAHRVAVDTMLPY
jgi:hypothetical protein